MKIDASELTYQLVESVSSTGFLDGWFFHLINKLSELCESPIEARLGAAMLFYDKFNGMPGFPLILAGQDESWPSGCRLLTPQYQFQQYRIDWVIREDERLTFIECDGHDFHERTKAQAGRDKLKDRTIQGAGHPILRFTGSEIFEDALYCAAQISEFVDNRNVPSGTLEPA